MTKLHFESVPDQAESLTFEDAGWTGEESSVSEDGTIRNVLLCGNKSLNGYDIPSTAFGTESEMKALYEGRHVFLNHRPDNPLNRDIRELAGVIRNVRLDGGKPRGDVVLLKTEAGQTLRSLVEAKVSAIGMSHTARYKFAAGKKAVERVLQVVSVDAVVNPATTKTFHEQEKGRNLDLEAALTKIAELTTQISEANAKITKADQRTAELAAENATLKQQVDSFQAEKAAAALKLEIETAVAAAGLDLNNKDLVSDVFMASLYKAEAVDRAALIAERAKIVKTTVEAAKGESVTVQRKYAAGSGKVVEVTEALNASNLFTR